MSSQKSLLLIQLSTLENKHFDIKLTHSPIVIGRSPNSDIFLPHASVSIRHAQLFWNEEKLMLTDLASNKGTWFEGERIPSFTEIKLQKGDFFYIGKYYKLLILDDISQHQTTNIVYQQQELSSLSQELCHQDIGWEIAIDHLHQNKTKSIRFFIPIDTQIKLFFNQQHNSIETIKPDLTAQQDEIKELLFKSSDQELSLIQSNDMHFLNQNQIKHLPQYIKANQTLTWFEYQLSFKYLSRSKLVIHHKILYLSLFSLLMILIVILRYISFS
jgi:hypothetical protein